MRQETKIYLLIGLVFVLSVAMVISDSLTEKKAGPPAKLTVTANQVPPTITHKPPIIEPENDNQGNLRPTGLENFGKSNEKKPSNGNGDIDKPQKVENDTGDSNGVITIGESEHPEETRKAQPIIHYVKDGETFWDIAKLYYGKGYLWKKIYQANIKLVGPKGIIRAGTRLEIPHKDAATPVIVKANKTDKTLMASNASTKGTRTYKVQKGDVLSKIASKELGKAGRYLEILKLNRDQLGTNGDKLKIGMILKLPSR